MKIKILLIQILKIKKNVEDKKQHLEMEDNLVQYSKHYEENSIENSIVLTEEGS